MDQISTFVLLSVCTISFPPRIGQYFFQTPWVNELFHPRCRIGHRWCRRTEMELEAMGGEETQNIPRLRSNGDLIILESRAYGVEF